MSPNFFVSVPTQKNIPRIENCIFRVTESAMADLNIVRLHFSGAQKHMMCGFLGMYTAGFAVAEIQRRKILHQLMYEKVVNQDPSRGPGTTFLRDLVKFFAKIVGSIALDQKLQLPERLCTLNGAALGAVLSFPLDSLRTTIALGEPKYESQDFFRCFTDKGCWSGVTFGLAHAVSTQFIARQTSLFLLNWFEDSDFFASTLGIRVSQFIGLSLGKMICTPLELVVREYQKDQIYGRETNWKAIVEERRSDVQGLWRGACFGIAEATVDILVVYGVVHTLSWLTSADE